MRVVIAGAAAGGGLPQWNCNGPNSLSFWTNGSASLRAASQSSIAASVDGENWALFNASPDLRSQIIACAALRPRDPDRHGLRDSPIGAVILTNGDVDHIAGLLTMREGHRFDLWTTADIGSILSANPIFNVLDPALVTRRNAELDHEIEVLPGLRVRLFSVPGKVPLYMEGETVTTDQLGEQTVGVEITDNARRAHYIPGCATMTSELKRRLDGSNLVLFDGTVYHDDEMRSTGVGTKTGKRMGHMAMAGPDGSMAAFSDIKVGRKIYVHINNTNPVWRPDSAERREVEAAGWQVGYDGMEIAP